LFIDRRHVPLTRGAARSSIGCTRTSQPVHPVQLENGSVIVLAGFADHNQPRLRPVKKQTADRLKTTGGLMFIEYVDGTHLRDFQVVSHRWVLFPIRASVCSFESVLVQDAE
jgi:hypothetical protein